MIYIGTDLVKISRIDRLINDEGQQFLKHVFTEKEQFICNAKATPYIHYGGKFAAKEAVKKALLSTNMMKNIPLTSIEIQNKNDGAPIAIIRDKNECVANIQISISHAGEYATAIAILEIK